MQTVMTPKHPNVHANAFIVIGPTLGLSELCEQAKLGNNEAKKQLLRDYNLRVFTYLELAMINRFISEGLTLDEAIKRLDDGSKQAEGTPA